MDFPLKLTFQFLFKWCCYHLCKLLFFVKSLNSKCQVLGVVTPSLSTFRGVLDAFNRCVQVVGCARCNGVCVSPFRRASLLYGLLCYGRKAKLTGTPICCVIKGWRVMVLFRQRISVVSSSSLATSLVFLFGVICWCAFCVSACWVSCLMWLNLRLRYHNYPTLKLELFILCQGKLLSYIWNDWLSMHLKVFQFFSIVTQSATATCWLSLTCFLPSSLMDKGKQKINLYLFSEVVKTTLVEVKNSSPAGDANVPRDSGKTNKQKNKWKTKKLSKIKLQYKVDVYIYGLIRCSMHSNGVINLYMQMSSKLKLEAFLISYLIFSLINESPVFGFHIFMDLDRFKIQNYWLIVVFIFHQLSFYLFYYIISIWSQTWCYNWTHRKRCLKCECAFGCFFAPWLSLSVLFLCARCSFVPWASSSTKYSISIDTEQLQKSKARPPFPSAVWKWWAWVKFSSCLHEFLFLTNTMGCKHYALSSLKL